MLGILRKVLDNFGAPVFRWAAQAAEVAQADWDALCCAATGSVAEACARAEQSTTRGAHRFVQFAAGDLHDLWELVNAQPPPEAVDTLVDTPAAPDLPRRRSKSRRP